MRIIFFSNAYKPTVSGVVTSMDLFRKGLLDAGHQPFIVAPEHTSFEDEDPFIFRLPALDLPEPIDFSLAAPIKGALSITVRGIKPDLIHSQHPILVGDLAAAFAHDLHIPLIFTYHSRYDEVAQRYIPIVPELVELAADEIIARYLAKCAHVVAPTRSIHDLIQREFGSGTPVSVVPTPVDLSAYATVQPQRIREALNLRDVELLLYLGRLAKEKDLTLLLQAFSKVLTARPQARLLFVGKGPEERHLQELAHELGLSGKVLFTGAVSHSDVPQYFAAADIFLFPSVTETQGLVLIESMAAGTPVVAAQSPAVLDALGEGGGAIVAAQEDAFASAIIDLLSDKPRREELGHQARRIAQRYAISAATARLIDVYQFALNHWPASATTTRHA
jgi:1,2-diacylglycerol 3-alpha-glucosyltransferase